jgi:CBS domain-containing protein
MTAAQLGRRETVCVDPTTSVAEIVRHMQEDQVGSVVVVKDEKPVGILTDRDLVLRVLAKGDDPTAVRAEDVMSCPVHVIGPEADTAEAAATMREKQVRRLPVVDEAGTLVGIVTLDDLLNYLGRTAAELAGAIASFPVPHFGG